MDAALIKQLKVDLLRDEGYRREAYKDSRGILTVGIGRNLESNGISLGEAYYLLENDIYKIWTELVQHLPWVVNLDTARQAVIVNMAFNLGVTGLLGFRKMLEHTRKCEFKNAGDEILKSSAAQSVPVRYQRLAYLMEFGRELQYDPKS